ncbi:hypothetical protein E4U11_002907 [Claviceps purpurea]|nr:hypothetical protein E4U11_002907 [Claviceps purpurea]
MNVLVEELDPTDKTGWWNRTQWVVHLRKSNLQHLSTDEPELKICRRRGRPSLEPASTDIVTEIE